MKRILMLVLLLFMALPLSAQDKPIGDIKLELHNTTQFGYLIRMNQGGNGQIRFLDPKTKNLMGAYDYEQHRWLEDAKYFDKDAIDLQFFFTKPAPPVIDNKPEGTIKLELHNSTLFGYLIRINQGGNGQIRFLDPGSKQLMAAYDFNKKSWIIQGKGFIRKNVDLQYFFTKPVPPVNNNKPVGDIKLELHNTIQFGYLIRINQGGNGQIRFLDPKTKDLMGVYNYINHQWVEQGKYFSAESINLQHFFTKPAPPVMDNKPEGTIKLELHNTVQFGYLIRINQGGNGQIRFLDTSSKKLMAAYDFNKKSWIIQGKGFIRKNVDLQYFFTKPAPPVNDNKPAGRVRMELHNTVQFGYLIRINQGGNGQIRFLDPGSKKLMAAYNFNNKSWIIQAKGFKRKNVNLQYFFSKDMKHNKNSKKPYKPKLNKK